MLFEYSGSRIALTTPLATICEALETHLLKFGVVASVKLGSEVGAEDKVMLVQRYDEKWQTYLNVDDPDQICDGDRLMVVAKPSKVIIM